MEIETSQRSAIGSSKLTAGRMVSTIFRLAGFEMEHAGGYPRLGRQRRRGVTGATMISAWAMSSGLGFKRADGLSRRGTFQRYISLFDSLYTGPLNSAFRGVP